MNDLTLALTLIGILLGYALWNERKEMKNDNKR